MCETCEKCGLLHVGNLRNARNLLCAKWIAKCAKPAKCGLQGNLRMCEIGKSAKCPVKWIGKCAKPAKCGLSGEFAKYVFKLQHLRSV